MQATCSFDGVWQGDRDHAPFRPYYLLAAFWHKAVDSGIVPVANFSAGAFAWVVEPAEFGAKAKMLCGLNATALQVRPSGQAGEGSWSWKSEGGVLRGGVTGKGSYYLASRLRSCVASMPPRGGLNLREGKIAASPDPS